MLLNVNIKSRQAEKRRGTSIQTFGFDERALQGILFKSLDRIFPEDEMILLMQSRNWQEEPDLMAIDKNGDLFIFELKAVGSHSENLLQVLRYGQIYGSSAYADLDSIYKRSTDKSKSLKADHRAKFGIDLPESGFNSKQIFVVMTNGVDYKTREAVRYWRSAGLDVRPWVYRVYEGGIDEMLLEISPFRVNDNPLEDLAEGYYILNTNISNSQQDHDAMLHHQRASAFFDPWKFKIGRLERGDVVFLYQSGLGIVAMGEADGKLQKAPYHGNQDEPDEEYFMKLRRFHKVSPPLSASEIKKITGINHVFMSTLFGLDEKSGKAIKNYILETNAATD